MKLVELVSRRAGLHNVGEVGQSLKTTGRRSSDDIPTGRCPGEQVPDLLDVIGSDAVLAAAASQRNQSDDERAEDKHTDDEDDRPDRADDAIETPHDEAHDQAEHLEGAAAGHGETARAPVGVQIDSDPAAPQAPLTVKLNPDTSTRTLGRLDVTAGYEVGRRGPCPGMTCASRQRTLSNSP